MPMTNQTYASLIYTTTEEYLSDMDMENNPGPETMEMELLAATNDAIRTYNNGAPDDDGNFPDKLSRATSASRFSRPSSPSRLPCAWRR